MERNAENLSGFLLNLLFIQEKLNERGLDGTLTFPDQERCLVGVSFYHQDEALSPFILYLVTGDRCSAAVSEAAGHADRRLHFAVCGTPSQEFSPLHASCLIFPEQTDLMQLFCEIQQIFLSCALLEKKLNHIVSNCQDMNEICQAASEHFHARVFVHDEYYHILASSQLSELAAHFSYNEQTGEYMQDVDTINQFRTSASYQQTLGTTGGQLWDSDYSNTCSAYANIRIDGCYKGRLVIAGDGVNHNWGHGMLCEVSYFAEIITLAMQQRQLPGETLHPLERLIQNAADLVTPDRALAEHSLQQMGWNAEDTYLCGILSFDSSDITRLSVYGLCNGIGTQFRSCYTCYYKSQIYLLVNMTKSELTLQELRTNMAYIIREGMLRMGVSFPFHNFHSISSAFLQAQITLRCSKEELVPKWFNEFGDYVLNYWLTEGIGAFTPETILPEELRVLKDYDKKQDTKLYETLKQYLANERNQTLTSQILKINRSTLHYRLKRIAGLTDANLDDRRTRLYLLMGFQLAE